ncbi:MAG: hypothetical protein JWM43_3010 [Acidobacteriaceae bacterium]|nr:hypothetical protein [Acidobacteriaceae bacterium]
MNEFKRWGRWVLSALVLGMIPAAHSQSLPTATQRFGVSVFGGGSGVFTDVYGGRNLSLTAGADLTLHSYYGLTPSIELRGTYPFKSGTIASEKAFLGGLKLEKRFGPLHPYADFLVGRGQIDYQNGGFVSGRFIYTYSSSTVYSPGVGVDYDLTDHWALKADYQYQLWTTYPLELKILKPSVFTGGVVYRFDFNHHPKAERPKKEVERAVRPVPPDAQAPNPNQVDQPPPPNPAP